MQGRQGREGEAWEKLASRKMAALNGTGKVPAIPQRPPGMTRIDQPPPTQRVGRPKREAPQPKRIRKFVFVGAAVLLICAVIAFFVGMNLFQGIAASSGPARTTTQFLTALSAKDYASAYSNLGPSITIQISQDEFARQGQADDKCYGPISDYPEVADSATSTDTSQTYTYNIKREGLKESYKWTITLQKDQDGTWKISDYGNDLGPRGLKNLPTCK
ncbi:hypothetical protein [Ktedonospora formicarum]|uniref:DUF4878 domain-containing protein n=1 Tax=Ktedonospora formicarum TaxID=2778364 RepID=A0A8J3I1E1_9CHLR|nr:hypothetical protein [Ktedonospora formicarum]GHO43134.1 hypothetical protein KSX_12970 [Ktedonospora formicarum]